LGKFSSLRDATLRIPPSADRVSLQPLPARFQFAGGFFVLVSWVSSPVLGMQPYGFHPRLTESRSSLCVFGICHLGFFFLFIIGTVTAEQVTGWRALYTPTSALLTGCADTVADFCLFIGSKIPVRGESSVSFRRWRRRGFGVEFPSDCFLSPRTGYFCNE
jgi:hypothetical protein